MYILFVLCHVRDGGGLVRRFDSINCMYVWTQSMHPHQLTGRDPYLTSDFHPPDIMMLPCWGAASDSRFLFCFLSLSKDTSWNVGKSRVKVKIVLYLCTFLSVFFIPTGFSRDTWHISPCLFRPKQPKSGQQSVFWPFYARSKHQLVN